MRDERLFRAFPLAGVRRTSCGDLPVPYQVYAGRVFLLGGSVAAEAAQQALQGQDAHVLCTRGGRALAALWICCFSEASLGAHTELQFSLAVTRRASVAVSAHPFELLRLIALEPELRQFPVRLWNDTSAVVAFNREVLGLDAQRCQARFDPPTVDGQTAFAFEQPTGAPIVAGCLEMPARQALADGWMLAQQIGRAGMARIAAQPWVSAQLMTPAGVIFAHNSESQAYLRAEKTTVTRYSPRRARLEIADPFLGGFGFQSDFVEAMDGFQFVYLPPYNLGDYRYGNTAA